MAEIEPPNMSETAKLMPTAPSVASIEVEPAALRFAAVTGSMYEKGLRYPLIGIVTMPFPVSSK